MIHLGRDELICDLAEVYSIYDMKSYPVSLIATLAVGLGVHSRIRSKQMNLPVDINTIILAAISDNVSNYIWAMGGKKGDAPGVFMKNLFYKENDIEEKRYSTFSNEDDLLRKLKGE